VTAGRALVLQMCRMGDLLQTGPMLRGIRREHPGFEVTLVTMDAFANVPLPAALYDRLVPFPQAVLRGGLTGPDADWQAQLDRLLEFVRELGGPFDVAINLTHSDLSSLLMSVVPARDRRGPVIKPDRKRAVPNEWLQYFWANARSRVLGCFNLVDLFTWTAGVKCDGAGLDMRVSDEADATMAAWLEARGLADRPLIAIQLGASEEAKRWPAERFAAAADLLPAAAGDIVLVGTPSERALADRFHAAVRRNVYDAVGATTVEQLGALLRRCRLLLTNDTGTMHVATAVGTRVLDISTGPVFVHETGPYGPGHVVVEPVIDCFPCAAGAECHHYGCRDRLSPEAAAGLALFALGEGTCPADPAIRVLTSRRAGSGCIEYWPVRPCQVTAHDVIRRLSARVWEDTLRAPGASGDDPEAALGPDEVRSAAAPDLSWAEHVGATLDEVASLAAKAAHIARTIATAPAARQADLANRAHHLLERLVLLGETERACHPIVGFLLVEIDSVFATDLPRVARAQEVAYSGAADRARRLAHLLRHPPCTAPCCADSHR
jgi:ADP-heptose:LPS heptosyltransferase